MRNKFNAKRCENGGYSFASQGERDCFLNLKLLEKAGEASEIECQVLVRLVGGINYRADFKFFDHHLDEVVWVEYKGLETQRWRDIKKLWKHCGPGRLRVYKGYGLRMKVTEEIIPDAWRKGLM